MKIAITGASGYIGRALHSSALDAKYNVLALTRTPITGYGNSEWQFYDLTCTANLTLPNDIQAVVHLAATTESKNLDVEVEVRAVRNLISSSHRVGAKFIFVSSQTAQSDAPTIYGRSKWIIEQVVLDAGGIIIRPGMVYGGCASGLFSKIIEIVREYPVLPKFIPDPLIQTIHVDDLSQCILKLLSSSNNSSKIYQFAEISPISFSDYLKEIAKTRVRKFRLFILVPISIFRLICKITGLLNYKNSELERLESLFALQPMLTKTDLALVDVKLRNLKSGMHSSGSADKRHILMEGHTLLSYILGCNPKSSLIRDYCRAIFLFRNGKPLFLPKIFIQLPILLSIIDKNIFIDSVFLKEFNERVNMATPIAEFSILGSQKFCELKSSFGIFGELTKVTIFLILGLLWRIIGGLLSPFFTSQCFHDFKNYEK